MKYKSELLNEILEQRGHEVPTLHYQSECVESWVDETKGAYPKLCDYEGEWLNYIVENPIGEFPYETVTTNNTATVNHVVPLAYKSAILKGQTLKEITNNLFDGEVEDGDYDINTGEKRDYSNRKRCANKIEINPSTTYTLSGITWYLQYDENGDYLGYAGANDKRLVFTSKNNARYLTFYNLNNESNFFVGLGDTEPLYELVSVKMPVLTTVGKNLFNGILLEQWSSISGAISNNSKTRIIKMKVKPNTTYVVTRTESGNRLDILMFASEPMLGVNTVVGTSLNSGGNATVTSFTTTNDTSWIIIRAIDNIDNYTSSVDFQVEEGSTATPYEPHKSNILTVNEPIELRGIEDVRDDLDLLTGEKVERIGEIVLDGSEDWVSQTVATDARGAIYRLSVSDINPTVKNDSINCICDKGKVGSWTTIINSMADKTFAVLNNQQLRVQFSGTLEELKTWLSEEQPTIQYLKTASVKTVDLTVVNQDGEPLSKIKPIEGTMHIEVSGTPINPTAVLEVPVEAITQNLNSFIEEE